MIRDIKNILEVFDMMDELAKAIKSSKADGYVNWLDIPKFARVLPAARAALQNSELIVPELMDLSETEAQIVMDRLFKASTALMDAVLTLPAKK